MINDELYSVSSCGKWRYSSKPYFHGLFKREDKKNYPENRRVGHSRCPGCCKPDQRPLERKVNDHLEKRSTLSLYNNKSSRKIIPPSQWPTQGNWIRIFRTDLPGSQSRHQIREFKDRRSWKGSSPGWLPAPSWRSPVGWLYCTLLRRFAKDIVPASEEQESRIVSQRWILCWQCYEVNAGESKKGTYFSAIRVRIWKSPFRQRSLSVQAWAFAGTA